MSKESVSSHVTVYAGIDVSAATLAVAVQREDREGFEQRQFANSAMGQTTDWLVAEGQRDSQGVAGGYRDLLAGRGVGSGRRTLRPLSESLLPTPAGAT